MTIVALNTRTEFAVVSETGLLRPLEEMNGDGQVIYAHSMQEAREWVRRQPRYENVQGQWLGDGRIRYTTEWQEFEGSSIHWHPPTHYRGEIVIYPVSTVFVTEGWT